MRSREGALVFAVGILCACGGGGASSTGPPTPTQTPTPQAALAQRISVDPFQGFGGQFATEVEPSVANDGGNALVAAFQQGRDIVAGGDAIGFATSIDGGLTWSSGTLPGITRADGGAFTSVSDAVVAYDAIHHVWLVASIPVSGTVVPYPVVSRSADGLHWNAPATVRTGDVSDDKEWIACDNGTASPFRGRCYLEVDDGGGNGYVHMSFSNDGGATWSTPSSPADAAAGIGGQILITKSGTVVVVIDGFDEDRVYAFASRNGGATWSASSPIAPITDHFQAGSLRSGPLVTAAIDASGVMYAVWQDCRFRTSCAQDDLVISTSTNGTLWSAPARIPIDPVSSGIDHFIPGIAIQPGTGGAGAHVGLTYYFYAASACATMCALSAAFVGSTDGANTWGAPVVLSSPMATTSLAKTTQGRMVADYATVAFVGPQPVSVFSYAQVPNVSIFDQATYATIPGAISAASSVHRSSRFERALRGARSDHPRRRHGPPLPR